MGLGFVGWPAVRYPVACAIARSGLWATGSNDVVELLITLPNGTSVRRPLEDGPQVIGRDAQCDIPIDDPSASRSHARFSLTPRGYIVEDLDSKNGTLVNDQPCTSQLLQNGDRVLIGSTVVVFSDGEGDARTSVIIAEDAPSAHATRYVSRDQRLLLSQRRLEMIYELSERLTTVQDRDKLLENAMSIGFETLGFERGAIGVRRRDGKTLDWPVVRNLRDASGGLTISRTLFNRALNYGERAIYTADDAGSADPTVSIVQQGIRSAMCVPLAHGDEILGVIYGDRLSSATAYSNEDSDFLAAIARQVSIGLINCRLVEEQQEMARLGREIDLARSIQKGLFPSSLPHRDNLRIAALNDPGQRVSGDYYDVIERPDGRAWCLIADVTGEGVAAALLMANLQAAVRVTIDSTDDPAALLSRWNTLIHQNTDASKFITCLLALVDPAKRRVRFATAGHCVPFVLSGGDVAPRELAATTATFPLGVVEQAEFATYEEDLGSESTVLFAYTDGVTEAMDAEEQPFGLDRLIEVLKQQTDLNPQGLIKRVRKDVAGFVGEARQSDDITMLAIHVS